MTVASAAALPPVVSGYVLAPYVATPHEVVERMLDAAEVGADDGVCELDSGNGQLAIAAAGRGARGIGYGVETNWIERAREGAGQAGVAGRTRFEVERGAAAPPRSGS
jgi:hypothetical protein